MAFTVTESNFVRLGGSTPALCMLVASVVNDGGDSGGVIQPGNELVGTSLTEARALRKVLCWGFTSRTAESAVEVDKSYDATHDGDILTLDCTANETIDFWILGFDNGS